MQLQTGLNYEQGSTGATWLLYFFMIVYYFVDTAQEKVRALGSFCTCCLQCLRTSGRLNSSTDVGMKCGL